MTDAKDRKLIGELRHEIQKQSSRVHVLTKKTNHQVDVITSLRAELKDGGKLTKKIIELSEVNVTQRLQLNAKINEVGRLQGILREANAALIKAKANA